MPLKTNLTLEAIDKHLEDNQESGHRWHLGASLLGRECARELWYIFRWAKASHHKGQLLRLFDRGNREESVFVAMLENIGCTVWEVDPETGDQFRISHCEQHLGGSLDGVAIGIPDIPDGKPAVTEFKTHGEKSFKKLKTEGMRKSKWEHYIQTILYVDFYELDYGFYMGVSKNTDELYLEVVEKDPVTAKRYIERGQNIIASDSPPPRCNDSPGWWKCKFCDYHSICHKGTSPDLNCRTCAHSEPIHEGKWQCNKKDIIFAKPLEDEDNYMLHGCHQHVFNPYMIDAELLNGDESENWLEIEHPTLGKIKIGPSKISTQMLKLILDNPEDQLDFWLHAESDCWGIEIADTSCLSPLEVDIVSREQWLKVASNGWA